MGISSPSGAEYQSPSEEPIQQLIEFGEDVHPLYLLQDSTTNVSSPSIFLTIDEGILFLGGSEPNLTLYSIFMPLEVIAD